MIPEYALERLLTMNNLGLSARRAIDLTKTIFQIEVSLPDSQEKISTFNRLTFEQQLIIDKIVR